VLSDAANSGYSTVNGDSITVNYPPSSGPSAGESNAVEVIVARPVQSFLSRVLFDGSTTVAARAVAVADINDGCVWALNPSAASALKVSGNAEVALGCGVLVNSTSVNGLVQSGSGCLEATTIKVVGGYSVACATPTPMLGASAFIDPLAPLAAPAYGACDYNQNITVNGGQDRLLTPGTYCGKIRVTGNGNLTFASGLYVLNGAGLDVSGQGTVTGADVSFYLTANSGVPDSITISGGAKVSLSADSGGPLPGILFYHDRNSTGNVVHRFTGGAEMDLDGVLYFPSQTVRFSGGSELESSEVMIIADKVEFSGDTEVDLESATGTSNPLLAEAKLVE
jgi:hypothetical protein